MILRNLHWWWDMWLFPGVDCFPKSWLWHKTRVRVTLLREFLVRVRSAKKPSGNGKPNMKVDSCFPWNEGGKPPASQPAGIDEKGCKVDLIPETQQYVGLLVGVQLSALFFPSLFPLLQKAPGSTDWSLEKIGREKDVLKKICFHVQNALPREKQKKLLAAFLGLLVYRYCHIRAFLMNDNNGWWIHHF